MQKRLRLKMDEHLADSDAMDYDMDRADGEWALSDYVQKGIEVLDNDTGFFMMCEGGKIDWACHANDAGTKRKEFQYIPFGDDVMDEFGLKTKCYTRLFRNQTGKLYSAFPLVLHILTMMTLWCMFRSPLMIGAELTKMDDFTLSLLTNKELLVLLSEDFRGEQLRRSDGSLM